MRSRRETAVLDIRAVEGSGEVRETSAANSKSHINLFISSEDRG